MSEPKPQSAAAPTSVDASTNAPAPASSAAAPASGAPAPAAPSLPAAFFAVPAAQLANPDAYVQSLFDQIAKSNTGAPQYKPPASAREGVLGGGTFASFMPTQPRFVPAPTFGVIPATQQPPAFGLGFGAGAAQPQQTQQQHQPLSFFGSGPTQAQKPSVAGAGFGAAQPQPFDFGAAFAPTQPTSVSAAACPPPVVPSTAAPLMPAFRFTFPSASAGAPAAPSSFAFRPAPVPAGSAAAAPMSSLFAPPAAAANPFSFPSASASSHCCFFCPEPLLSPEAARDHLMHRHGFMLREWNAAVQIGLPAQTRLLRCLRAEVESQRAQLNGSFPPPSSMQQILHAAVSRFQADQEGSGAQSPAFSDLLVQWLPAVCAPRCFCPFCEEQLTEESSSGHAGHIRSYHGIDLPALAERFRLDRLATAQMIAHIRSAVMSRAFTVPNAARREAEVMRDVEATLHAHAEGRGGNAQSEPWRHRAHLEMALAARLLTPPPPPPPQLQQQQQPAMTLADFPSSTPSLVVHASSAAVSSAMDSAEASSVVAPAESNVASALSAFFAPQNTAAAAFSASANAPASEAAPSSGAVAAAASAAPVPAVDAVCLFCHTRLVSADVAKEHLRAWHSFELSELARRFRMSFDAQMQCINWIRRHMDRDLPSLANITVNKFTSRYPFATVAEPSGSIPGRTVDDDLLLVWLPEDGHEGDPAEEGMQADGDGAAEEEEQAQVAGIPAIKTASSFAPLSAFLAAPTSAASATEAGAAASPAAVGFGFAPQPLPTLADAAAASALSGFAQPQPQQPSLPLVAANIVPFSFSPPAKKPKATPAAAGAAAAAPAAMSNGDAPYSMFGRERKPLPPVAEKLHTHAAAPLSFLGPPSASTFAFPTVAVTRPAPCAQSAPAAPAAAAAAAPNFSFLSSLTAAAPSTSAAAPIVDADALFPSSDRPWMEKQSVQHFSKLRPTIYSVVKKPAAEGSTAGQESKDQIEAKPAAAMAGLAFSFDPKPAKAAAAAASSIAPFSFQPPLPTEAMKDAPRTLAEIAPVDSSPEELASNDALSHVFRFLDLRTMHTVMSVAHRWRSIVSHMRSMQFPCPSLPLLWRLLPSQRSRLPSCSFFSTLDLFHPIDPKTLPLSALAKRHIGSVDLTLPDPAASQTRGVETISLELMNDLAIAMPQLRRLTCAVGSCDHRLPWPRALDYLNLSIHTDEQTAECLPQMLETLGELSHLHEVHLRAVRSGWLAREQFGEKGQEVPAAALQALPACVRTLVLHGELSADQVAVLRRRLPNLLSLTVQPPPIPPYFLSFVKESLAAVATRISTQIVALTADSSADDRGAGERPPQLQELNVVHGWTAELAMALARVKTLTTLACIEVGPELHLDLLASLRALRTLSVSFKPTAEDADALVVALSHAPQLTNLTLQGHSRLRPAHVSAILSTHLQLQSLTLRALPNVDSVSFFAESNPPPAVLSTVDLRDLNPASCDDLSPLLSLPAIRSLNIFSHRPISPHRADVSDLRARLGDAFKLTSAFFR